MSAALVGAMVAGHSDMASRGRVKLVIVLCVVGATALGLAVGGRVLMGRPVVVQEGCPAILRQTNNAAEDYPDMVAWRDQSYLRAQPGARSVEDILGPGQRVRVGRQVGTVHCNLADPSSTDGHRVAPGRWPDGTATGLPRGTALMAVQGIEPSCVLAVKRQEEVVAYIAYDMARSRARC